MNKVDLVETLKRQSELTKEKAEEVVNVFFEEMSKALSEGDRIEIRGFCSFNVRDYKPYRGRNPKTGEPVEVSPKKLPFFKCGKELKERVDHNQV